MSHHGERPFDTLDERGADNMRELFKERLLQAELGATGKQPEGKLAKGDEGEIMFAIGHQFGKVTLDFGKAVAWVGMNPDQAEALAATIMTHANKARLIQQDKSTTEAKATAKV